MLMIYFSVLVISLGVSIILSTSPLILGVWVLFLSLMISFLTGMLYTSWFGFILFLIYIGGMLVMFAYFVSIQPNHQYSLKNLFGFMMLVFFNLILNKYNITIDLMYNINWWISSLFNLNNISILILIGFILFLALVMVVKITTFMMAPLRPYFKYV